MVQMVQNKGHGSTPFGSALCLAFLQGVCLGGLNS